MSGIIGACTPLRQEQDCPILRLEPGLAQSSDLLFKRNRVEYWDCLPKPPGY